MGILSCKYWKEDQASRRENNCFQLCKGLPCGELVCVGSCYTTSRGRTRTNNSNDKSSYLLLGSFSVSDTTLYYIYKYIIFITLFNCHNNLDVNNWQLPRNRYKTNTQNNILTISHRDEIGYVERDQCLSCHCLWPIMCWKTLGVRMLSREFEQRSWVRSHKSLLVLAGIKKI